MNSEWMCISHHLPKYVFNRFQQCSSRVGSAKSAAFGRLSSESLANLSESWNAFDDIVWIRVYPCVFASGFIRAINMDRSQSQLAKKYWGVKSEEWVEATRHVTRVLPKQQDPVQCLSMFHMFRRLSGFASRPISKFRLPQRRRAVWADLPQSREDPLTALQMEIWSNAARGVGRAAVWWSWISWINKAKDSTWIKMNQGFKVEDVKHGLKVWTLIGVDFGIAALAMVGLQLWLAIWDS